MKNILITCAFLLLVLHSFGQSPRDLKMKHMMDSIRAARLDELALKNPMLRQAGVSTEVFAPGKITSDIHGNSFLKAKFQTMRTNVYFNVPIIQRKKNIFSASVAATYQSMQLYDVTSYETSMPVHTQHVDKTILRTSFTYTRRDSLLHRPVIYSATVSGLMNPETGQYQLIYNGAVIMSVIQTKSSNFSVGLLALRDPTAPLPFIPFISYYHKFKSPGLELFFDPSRIALRKELSPRKSIALSNNIDRTMILYEQHDAANLPRKHAFTL
ncbi:MAG TPA: hypothetical protein VIM65_04660, partial [Cyclobacteriaceae bacterium]